MNIVINGKDANCSDSLTVSELLVEQSVKMPEMVSVEVNGEVLRREAFDITKLTDDDKVEFLYFMEAVMALSEEQIERYSRQIILEEVGGTGQEKLLDSKVLIIGAGGLGSPAGLYLAASGVGTIGIIDNDKVDLTNLQRQILHHTDDVGTEKTESARATMRAVNPDVTVRTYQMRATAENIAEVIRQYDFVIDGTDNFPAKFLINDACFFEKVPFVHAGILRFYGQMITVLPGETTCYRCIFRSPPPVGVVPTCSEAGVLGAVAGVIGSLQAGEALKYLLGVGELLTGKLLTFDALAGEIRTVTLNRNPDCPLCGSSPEITELKDEEQPVCDLNQGPK